MTAESLEQPPTYTINILNSVRHISTDQLILTKNCDKHIELGNASPRELGTRRWSSEMMKQLSILVSWVRGSNRYWRLGSRKEAGTDLGGGGPDCAPRREPTTGSRVRRPEDERRGGTRFRSAGSGNRGRQVAEEGGGIPFSFVEPAGDGPSSLRLGL